MSQYYVHVGDQTIGPYSEGQLQEMITYQQVPVTAMVWTEGWADWMSISDALAQSLFDIVPPEDAKEMVTEVELDVDPTEVDWYFLNKNNKDFGPVDTNELTVLLYRGVITRDTHVFCSGMNTWFPLQHIPMLFKLVETNRGNMEIKPPQIQATDVLTYAEMVQVDTSWEFFLLPTVKKMCKVLLDGKFVPVHTTTEDGDIDIVWINSVDQSVVATHPAVPHFQEKVNQLRDGWSQKHDQFKLDVKRQKEQEDLPKAILNARHKYHGRVHIKPPSMGSPYLAFRRQENDEIYWFNFETNEEAEYPIDNYLSWFASKIQNQCRVMMARVREGRAVLMLQAGMRGMRDRGIFRKMVEAERLRIEMEKNEEMKRLHQAATKIQARQRGIAAREWYEQKKKYFAEIEAALVIGRAWRVYRAKRIVNDRRVRYNGAALSIQRIVRGYFGRLKFRFIYNRNSKAATNMQRTFRGHMGRKRFEERREEWEKEQAELYKEQYAAAIKIQKIQRGISGRKRYHQLKNWEEHRNNSATKIQKLVRGVIARQRVSEIRDILEDERRALEAKRNAAATVIQRRARGIGGRNRVHVIKIQKAREQNAALKIQRVERGRKDREKVRAIREEMRLAKLEKERMENEAASRIQAQQRRIRDSKKVQAVRERKALEIRSAIHIQRVFRGHVGRKAYKKVWDAKQLELARLAEQKKFEEEMERQRQEEIARIMAEEKRKAELARIILENKSATLLQSNWRGASARMRVTRIRRDNAARLIQPYWRSKLARLFVSKRRVTYNNAAVQIQRIARGMNTRIWFEKADNLPGRQRKRATLKIQCAWRTAMAKSEVSKRRAAHKERMDAATEIQRIARGIQGRKKAKDAKIAHLKQEKRRKDAADTMQRGWRCYWARKTLTTKRLRLKSAIRLQCFVRYIVAINILRRKQLEHRSSIKIQSTWRGKLGRDRHHAMYTEKKNNELRNMAATNIQRIARGYIKRQWKEKHLERRDEAALQIQCAWYCYCARKIYNEKYHDMRVEWATRTIQRVVRGHWGRAVARGIRSTIEKGKMYMMTIMQEARTLTFLSMEESLDVASREAAMKKLQEEMELQRQQEEMMEEAQRRAEEQARLDSIRGVDYFTLIWQMLKMYQSLNYSLIRTETAFQFGNIDIQYGPEGFFLKVVDVDEDNSNVNEVWSAENALEHVVDLLEKRFADEPDKPRNIHILGDLKKTLHVLPHEPTEEELREIEERKEKIRQDWAIVIMQRIVRGHCARQRVERRRLLYHRSSLDIQRVYRGHVGRKRYEHFHKVFNAAATMIQRNFRGLLGRLKFRREVQKEVQRIVSAKRIQSMYRGWKTRVLLAKGINEYSTTYERLPRVAGEAYVSYKPKKDREILSPRKKPQVLDPDSPFIPPPSPSKLLDPMSRKKSIDARKKEIMKSRPPFMPTGSRTNPDGTVQYEDPTKAKKKKRKGEDKEMMMGDDAVSKLFKGIRRMKGGASEERLADKMGLNIPALRGNVKITSSLQEKLFAAQRWANRITADKEGPWIVEKTVGRAMENGAQLGVVNEHIVTIQRYFRGYMGRVEAKMRRVARNKSHVETSKKAKMVNKLLRKMEYPKEARRVRDLSSQEETIYHMYLDNEVVTAPPPPPKTAPTGTLPSIRTNHNKSSDGNSRAKWNTMPNTSHGRRSSPKRKSPPRSSTRGGKRSAAWADENKAPDRMLLSIEERARQKAMQKIQERRLEAQEANSPLFRKTGRRSPSPPGRAKTSLGFVSDISRARRPDPDVTHFNFPFTPNHILEHEMAKSSPNGGAYDNFRRENLHSMSMHESHQARPTTPGSTVSLNNMKPKRIQMPEVETPNVQESYRNGDLTITRGVNVMMDDDVFENAGSPPANSRPGSRKSTQRSSSFLSKTLGY